MVSNIGTLKFHWIIAALVLLAGCGGNGYTSGQKAEIACDEFPIKITYEEKDIRDSKCSRRTTSDPMLMATYYHLFFRFNIGRNPSFANVQFAEAGTGTKLNVRSVKEKMLGFKKIRTSSSDWGEEKQTTVSGKKYYYINFSLPVERSCVGYSHYFDISWSGYYTSNSYGFVCNDYNKIDVSQLVDFLKHLKYR